MIGLVIQVSKLPQLKGVVRQSGSFIVSAVRECVREAEGTIAIAVVSSSPAGRSVSGQHQRAQNRTSDAVDWTSDIGIHEHATYTVVKQ